MVKQRHFWPGMDKDVKDWCQRCEGCALTKKTHPRVHAPMGHLFASRPNQVLAIDFTLLELARDGRELVMVMTDVFSNFTQAKPTRDQKAATVAKVLVCERFYYFGLPARIHSEQGRNFEGVLVQRLCEWYGIQKSHTAPYPLQEN